MTNLELIRTLMLVVILFMCGCMTANEEKEEQRKHEQRRAEMVKIRN